VYLTGTPGSEETLSDMLEDEKHVSEQGKNLVKNGALNV
jgi:hypothetical protein